MELVRSEKLRICAQVVLFLPHPVDRHEIAWLSLVGRLYAVRRNGDSFVLSLTDRIGMPTVNRGPYYVGRGSQRQRRHTNKKQ